MHAQVSLLETLVTLWDHDLCLFDLQAETLELMTEEIYFITGLSHRGGPMNMEGIVLGGDPLSVQDYINTYFLAGTYKLGTQIIIGHIKIFHLKVLVSTVVRVAGSSTLHLAAWKHMCIVVEFVSGMLYDWCSRIV